MNYPHPPLFVEAFKRKSLLLVSQCSCICCNTDAEAFEKRFCLECPCFFQRRKCKEAPWRCQGLMALFPAIHGMVYIGSAILLGNRTELKRRFISYEIHSIVDSKNKEMVNRKYKYQKFSGMRVYAHAPSFHLPYHTFALQIYLQKILQWWCATKQIQSKYVFIHHHYLLWEVRMGFFQLRTWLSKILWCAAAQISLPDLRTASMIFWMLANRTIMAMHCI